MIPWCGCRCWSARKPRWLSQCSPASASSSASQSASAWGSASSREWAWVSASESALIGSPPQLRGCRRRCRKRCEQRSSCWSWGCSHTASLAPRHSQGGQPGQRSHSDPFCISNLLDGLGDAGVVEGGGDAAMESLSISLPLANVPAAFVCWNIFSIQTMLHPIWIACGGHQRHGQESEHRQGRPPRPWRCRWRRCSQWCGSPRRSGCTWDQTQSEVLLKSLAGYLRGGDDLLATLSDGGVLKHIHHSLANLCCFTLAQLQSNGVSVIVQVSTKLK